MANTKLGRLVSLNVGLPHQVPAIGGTVLTAIFKAPVEGRVVLRGNNLAGDRQADLTVHGGRDKAVYGYPHEHYAQWRAELDGMELPFGMFGENLTTEGVTEHQLHIGDTLRIGSTVLKVTQPRMPCYKLALRFGRPDMVKRFWRSGRSGFYFSVVEEGDIGAGDAIELIAEDPGRVTIAQVGELARAERPDRELLQRALASPLKGGWKEQLQERWQAG